MLKKLSSLVLSVVMIISLLTTGVMAEATALTLDTFNATTSKLMIDLANVNGQIDEATLTDKIELLKRNDDGTESAMEFTAAASETKYDTTATDTVVSDGNTIVVTPLDGFEPGVYYRAILKAGIADTAANAVASNISTGYFAVNIVYSDDFNVKFDVTADEEGNETKTLASPYIANGAKVLSDNWYNNIGRVGISLPGDALSLAADLNNGDDTKLAFGSTTGWVLFKSNMANGYTVEYDYTFPKTAHSTGARGHMIYLKGIDNRTRTDDHGYYLNQASGFAFGTDWNPETKTSTVGLREGNTKSLVYSQSYTFNDSTIKVTASVDSNKNYKLYADNDKLFDTVYTPTNNQSYVLSFYGDNMAYIDNFKVTSLTKLGIDSFANELTLKNFNATTTVATVDLNGVTNGYAIDAATLTDNVKLYKRENGIDTECAIESFKVNQPHSGVDAEGNMVTVSEGNTITITPEGGLIPNVLYKVVVGAGVSDTSSVKVSTIKALETPYFYVNVLYSSDFNVKFDDNGELVAPYYLANNYVHNSDWIMDTGRNAISASGVDRTTATDLKASYDTAGGNLDTAISSDGGGSKLVLNKAVGNDYTVEYNYRLPKTQQYSDTNYPYHKAGLRGGNFRPSDAPNYSTGFKIFNKYSSATKANIAFTANGTDDYIINNYIFSSQYNNIRISGIGTNFKMYVNEEKLFDVEKVSPYNGGAFAMWDASQTSNINGIGELNMSEIDDMIITRIMTVSDISSKVAFSKLGTDNFSEEEIKTTVNLLNMTYAEKAFDLIFASYDSNGVLIDVEKTAASIDLNSSAEYTATLDNSELNTDMIKVFAWSGALEPLGKAVKK